MSLLIELLPMLFGYVAKLLAIKSKASTDSLNLAIMLNNLTMMSLIKQGNNPTRNRLMLLSTVDSYSLRY